MAKLFRLKWNNLGEQTGFFVKCRREKEWRDSILITCHYPHRSDLGGAFDSRQVEANFFHGMTNFGRATYTIQILVATCY